MAQEKPDVRAVAAVVIAECMQMRADAETHPDPGARDRILRGVSRVEQMLKGRMTPDMERIVVAVAQQMAGVIAA